MNVKVVAGIAVMFMMAMAFVPLLGDDSSAATEPVTVHAAPSSDPWVTKQAYASIPNFYLYFTENPSESVRQYLMSEITLDELKTRHGYRPSWEDLPVIYTANYGGSGENYQISCRKNFEVYGNFLGNYTNDPYDGLVSYLNKTISLSDLKTNYGYTDAYPSDRYQISQQWDGTYQTYYYVVTQYSGGSEVSTRNTNLPFETRMMYFYKDPSNDLQRYINKEISLDEFKSSSEYVDSSTMDWSRQHYSVNWNNNSSPGYYCESQTQYRASAPANNLYGQAYFTEDPYDQVVRYINDEITLEDLKGCCGYTSPSSRLPGTAYYIVSISGNYVSTFANEVRFISVVPHYVYLDAGDYYISITDTDYTYVPIQRLSTDRYTSIEIKDRKGAEDISVTTTDAIWFSDNNSSAALEESWREKTITYVIDPTPSEGKRMTDFSRTATVLSDKEWVKYTTVDSYTGEYYTSNPSTYIFNQGSDEETAFRTNVVDKGQVDGSEYGKKSVNASNNRLVAYELRQTEKGTGSYVGLNYYDGSRYNYISAECDAEKMSVNGVEPYKFYANYDFTIAVQYDVTKIRAVMLMYTDIAGNTIYAALESGRVYDLKMKSSAEYELYYIPANSSSGTMSSTEIGIYTENVGTSDNNGMLFAVVAIIFCVLAFGTLFMAGRTPRWKDDTGLPDFDASTPESPSGDVPEDIPAEIDENK